MREDDGGGGLVAVGVRRRSVAPVAEGDGGLRGVTGGPGGLRAVTMGVDEGTAGAGVGVGGWFP